MLYILTRIYVKYRSIGERIVTAFRSSMWFHICELSCIWNPKRGKLCTPNKESINLETKCRCRCFYLLYYWYFGLTLLDFLWSLRIVHLTSCFYGMDLHPLLPSYIFFLKSCFENNMQCIVQLSATFVCALGLIYLYIYFFASPLVTGLHAVPMGGILCWTSGSNCCDEGARAVHGQVGLRVPVLGW